MHAGCAWACCTGVSALPQAFPQLAVPHCPISLQSVHIAARAAALLPQVFPQVASLRLRYCKLDTVALYEALGSCQRLRSLELVCPNHLDPEGLFATAMADAAAFGVLDGLMGAVGASMSHPSEYGLSSTRCSAATGLLLGSQPHLTSLKLDMPSPSAALMLLSHGGTGSQVEALSVVDTGHSELRSQPALLAQTHGPVFSGFSSLRNLELGSKLGPEDLVALAASPTVAGLHTLTLPSTELSQSGLDAILQGMPGERREGPAASC